MRVDSNTIQRGFTLIEILIVLFICSFIMLSGLYQWQQQVERQRLIDAARQVSEFIYSQMIEGVYLNRYQILSVKVGKGDWQLIVKDANNKQQVGKLTAERHQGITLSKASRTSIQLYGKQGTIRAFSIELKNQHEQITIYISSLGRIRSCSHKKMAGVPKCWPS
ncbi:prepilin-type N-terminal cleavage/methylation domain-containing protein [Providencia rettgeri]|nr:prepilin-type N-terminal cleavage/methylation domain-containing protein [Providencia rettgeri]MDI7243611.1 prepilin-type N-terminal cleavage/methylation domain-containing protein [Providencia rettgeri]MDK3108566.1 prepilin-type N-terminal cleavage/methylation domain-containing protein [Providencia rettgeri]MDL9989099.1 prepilin-type N-terminal cleavage/methylation domain-containing protein [Providencia rettgeri]MDM9285515.1 prepilin-type N-terminal cleavage/methylation domain-containing prot